MCTLCFVYVSHMAPGQPNNHIHPLQRQSEGSSGVTQEGHVQVIFPVLVAERDLLEEPADTHCWRWSWSVSFLYKLSVVPSSAWLWCGFLCDSESKTSEQNCSDFYARTQATDTTCSTQDQHEKGIGQFDKEQNKTKKSE